jgi:peptidoglycan hydrolase-like protein with peptidoglycan-binding domain
VTVDTDSHTRGEPQVDGHRPIAPAPAVSSRRGPGRRTVLVAVLALIGAGAAVAAVVLGGEGGGSSGSSAGGTAGLGAVPIERRTLAQRDASDGTLGYTDTRAVLNRLRGTTITWLPRAGTIVERGHRLYAIDAKPVLLFYGSQPAYRPLSTGVSDGADVEQLQENLRALGYYDGTADGHFGSTTKAAVQDWQRARGLDATGTVELGRVVFLPGARRIGQISAVLGGQAAPGQVMQTTSTRRAIKVNLGVDKQDDAKHGARVRVTLPDESVVSGRITAVGSVAQGRGSQATIPVTVRLSSHRGLAGLDQAPVSVSFANAIARHVLAVPVTALMARAGGTYAVVVVGPGRRRTSVPVTPGLFADGYVQIEGRRLREGMRVENAE